MNSLLTSTNIDVLNVTHNHFYRSGFKYFGERSLLIGMSPGNGYFTESNMRQIIAGLGRSVPNMYIVIPDQPHVNNFLGMGYPKDEAARKAKKDINQTRNRLNRATSQLIEERTINFRLLDWATDIAAKQPFQLALKQIISEYNANKAFREAVHRVTYEYLLARAQGRTTLKLNVAQGAVYYLEELALFASQAQLFGEPVSVAYYKLWGEGLDYIADLFPEFVDQFSLIQYQVKQSATPTEMAQTTELTEPSL